MKDSVTRVLLVILIAGVGYLAYSIGELKDDVRYVQQLAGMRSDNSGQIVNALNPPLMQIQKNQMSASAATQYSELLLEGLVRKAGLPLDKARAEFERLQKGTPAGWTWLPVWEAAPAPAPAPATTK